MIPPRLSHIHSEAYAASVGADALGIARDLPGHLHIVNAVVSGDENVGTISDMYLDVADQALRGRLDGRAAIQGALDDAQTRAEALFIGRQ
jgi:hypothetical protein